MPILPLVLAALPAAALSAAAPSAAALPVGTLPEPHAAWVGQSVLASDAEERWIPFDMTPGNQIRFTMAIEGRPVTAILDTGVSYSVLARRYAEAHKLPVRAGGRATVIGGSVNIGRVATGRIAIGAVTRRGGSLAVADLPAAATGSAQAVDLLVGRDLTAGYALDIDYQARRFRLLRSGSRPFAGAVAPLSIAPGRMIYVSAIGIGGRTIDPMVVDSGDGSAITLGPAAWAAVRDAGGRVTTTVSFGLAGAVVNEMTIVRDVTIGATTARDVEVRGEPSGGFSDTVGVAGRIGSGFLQRYRVLLDPGAGHMLLGTTPATGERTLRSTSGLLLNLATDRLTVLHVMRGSPAAANGWRVGDTICAVDGTRITPAYSQSPLAAWTAAPAGRTVTLDRCDGRTTKITLRNFY